MFMVLSAVYVAGVLFCSILGIGGMLIFAEDGRSSSEFCSFKTLFIFAFIFPYGIYKIIKTLLDAADQDILNKR